MSFTTEQFTINGNASNVPYVIGPRSGMSNHDCVVIRPEGGGGGLVIERITVFQRPRYRIRVTNTSANAQVFRFSAEAMD